MWPFERTSKLTPAPDRQIPARVLLLGGAEVGQACYCAVPPRHGRSTADRLAPGRHFWRRMPCLYDRKAGTAGIHASVGAAGYEYRALAEVWVGDGLLECLVMHAPVCVWQSLGGVTGVDLRRYEAFPVAQMDTAVCL